MTEATGEWIRRHAEEEFAHELAALAAADDKPRPAGWRLSPKAAVAYLMGAKLPDGTRVKPKYIGDRRLMEIAVATLATDRALLLYGAPGTAKSWVSEHIAAAVCGDSTRLVQGTAGTDEGAVRYGWNYASLIAKGPSPEALVPTPILTAMRDGSIARIEELTRIPSETQDCLITVLSEKTMPVPELSMEIRARPGFNIIATANDRDRGVNEMSSALRRRFNTVVLPLPSSLEEEVSIVERRVADLGRSLGIPVPKDSGAEIRRVVGVFRELRAGLTEDGKTKLKSPSGSLSTAEAISVVCGGLSLAAHFGDGTLRTRDVAAGLVGAIVKEPAADGPILREYLDVAAKGREGWAELRKACRDLL